MILGNVVVVLGLLGDVIYIHNLLRHLLELLLIHIILLLTELRPLRVLLLMRWTTMMIFTGLDHLFTHQKLISVFIDEHLMLDRWYLILLRLDISDLCLVVQLLNLRLLRLLLNQQVISNLSNLNLSLWIILNLQMNFLNFIRMGFQFVASLFHEAPVLICFIKLKIFIYVVTHLVLLFIFFLNILTTLTIKCLLLARLTYICLIHLLPRWSIHIGATGIRPWSTLVSA